MRSGITATGFALLLVAVIAGVGSDGLGLRLGFVGVLAGATLIAIGGVRMAEEPTTPMNLTVLTGVGALTATAFLRRNRAVLGLAMASSAAMAVSGEASPVLCFGFFALLLLGVALVTFGVIGDLG